MLAISSEDFIDYGCVNQVCDSAEVTSIGEVSNISVVKCDCCGTLFAIVYGELKATKQPFLNNVELCPHPKQEKKEESHTF